MADEDNFDIDIYGDDTNADYQQETSGETARKDGHQDAVMSEQDIKQELSNSEARLPERPPGVKNALSSENERSLTDTGVQQISSTGGTDTNQVQLPKQAPVQQGTKRKDGPDDRPTDPGATTALLISELHWWQNEDDVRGWANQSGCEDELKEVTFNEHKVNGKSKGQVFISLDTAQAATALKRKVESFGQDQQNIKRPNVIYHPPHINPYRTLPKDVPHRKDVNRSDNRSSSSNFGGNSTGNLHNKFGNQSGFQGNRSFGNQNRGGLNQMNFPARNFNTPMNGMQGAAFGGPMSGGFGGNQIGGMPQFGNFGRGGMMSNMRGGMSPGRGGRGGMNPTMMNMGMSNMNGMNMNMPMGMGMNMNGMQGPGSFGNNAQAHFNPAFFGQGQSTTGGGDNWNPHGAKRPRPE